MAKLDRVPKAKEQATVRLDTWLWAARFFKTRSLAKQAVEAGRVRLADMACKPAHALHVGATLRITRGEECFDVDVLALGERRDPASFAQTLYRESDASRAARESRAEQRRVERAGYQPPERKPDKRARRLIRALGDIDSR